MSLLLIAALDSATILWWVDVVLKVAVGLGAVIFVHELGHFLVAKACGVKCEKFFVGFDIGGYKLSRRWGETEYGIGILPLGGYVKMLGQDDDPAHITEQMLKSQINAASENAVPITGPAGESYYVDRRSYLAKSVPQRMAIISAGVVMNVIFAFIFAVIAYGMGVPYMPCIVSETVPGSPAWRAGIEPGDEIVQIGERVDPTFMQLRGGVTLGDLENGIPCVVRRAADGQVVQLTLKPEQNGGRLATIGIGGPQTLTLLGTIDDSPAARAVLVSPPVGEIKAEEAKLLARDEIIRVGDVAVRDYRELSSELARQPDKPVRVTVRRPQAAGANNDEGTAPSNNQPARELVFELPAQPLRELVVTPKIGPIVAIRAGSPAAAAGIAIGDVIDAVDGKPPGAGDGEESWDAATLPEYLRRAAAAGREVELTLRRRQSKDAEFEQAVVRLTPGVPIQFNSPFPPRSTGTPLSAEAAGFAYRVENEVAAISPGSAGAGLNIKAGEVVTAAKVTFAKSGEGEALDPVSFDFAQDKSAWASLLDAIQFAADGTVVELTVQNGDATERRQVELKPVADDSTFVAARGFWFGPLERIRKAESFAEQVRYGWDETTESLTMVFRFLQKLGSQVPITALGGPVTIAKAAGYSAAEGLPSLLVFLTMLSANLAVINFLPIPVLDGGHMVFLAYEWIRGRPANEKFVVAMHTAGFVLIVSLMLYVLALDFNLIERNL